MKKSDLKRIGTIVQTRNKKRYAVVEKPDWTNNEVLCCLNNANRFKLLSDWDDDLKSPTNRDYDIMRVQEPFDGIYWERPAEILDDAERKYLSVVIKPFKNNVKFISKIPGLDFEYIYGKVNSDGFSLPVFKKGTMYKRMEECKEYTLKELGLE